MSGSLWTLLTLIGIQTTLASEMAGVSDPPRAEYHWIMHCQGCHGVSAQGTSGGVPAMAGVVGKFLQSAEGRAFLARVPGVAFVNLSDADVAELLNWIVQRFDPQHVPKPFTPYKEEEVQALRRDPLISEASKERQKILNPDK